MKGGRCPILKALAAILGERRQDISDGNDDAVALADARVYYHFLKLEEEAPGEEERLKMNVLIETWKTNDRPSRTRQLENIVNLSKRSNHILSLFWKALVVVAGAGQSRFLFITI
jgi:hypothetical protein